MLTILVGSLLTLPALCSLITRHGAWTRSSNPVKPAFNLTSSEISKLKNSTACNSIFVDRQNFACRGVEHANAGECGSTWSHLPQATIETRHELFPGTRVIVDIGGNTGEDVKGFLYHYPDAQIFTFEPIPQFYNYLKNYFAGYANVRIYNYGVSDRDQEAIFNVDGPASSGLNSTGNGNRVYVKLRDINAVLSEVRQETKGVLDVVSINCEGCEYTALERMMGTGWLGSTQQKSVPFVQVSWHIVDGVDNRLQRRCAIEHALEKKYEPVYHSYFGWSGWKQQ
eukprot:gnl/MRDRNA2_/MRDRNA2_91675_c0_seq1.p1 gnl/MRDRNA2_/MRDRNA2_91675_c0~~gnl/MRDRNA2_/MRDRNA2_91675_c0_seq1.p1  ORF type:complete len:283 (-),score=43.88 gnl/MRDRNA2_/MRDRNA2_91675_c0_seq1:22-870(-)